MRRLRCRTLLVRDLEHCGFDSFENLKIPCAPAQVPGDRFANLIASGVGILIQQCLRGHQNCRCAIAALGCAEIGESILQWMKVAVFSEAFHSKYFPPTAFEGDDEAREYGLAI